MDRLPSRIRPEALHVALVAPAWPPASSANGIVTYVRWMREGLVAEGCRVSVFAFAVDAACDDPDVHPIAPARVFESPLQRVAKRLFGKRPSVYDCGEHIAAAISGVHAEAEIDVIEMEESFGWAATVRAATRLPVVVKLHGPAFLHLVEEDLATPFGQEKVQREGVALEQLPVVLSPSEGHLAATLKRYALRPAIAEHLVNPLALGPDVPVWALSGCDPNLLLFVGRFDKVKGGDIVIRAFDALWRKRPELRLMFVGPDPGLVQRDGTMVGIASYIAALGGSPLVERVQVCGRLPPERIAALRVQAMCTIVASRCESQGYTALEAMLQGCPVVCTDASGLRELIEPGVSGLQARTGDAEDLASKLEQIMQAPDMAEALGARARQDVLRRHDPQRVAARAIEIYQRAISMAASDVSSTTRASA